MSYNWGRRRNRLRKGKKGMNSFLYQKSPYGHGSRATFHPIYNKHRRTTPEWGGLHKAWVGYVIAKSQDDYEKMRKYAIAIRKFERRLNIAINDFPEIGIYGFEEREDFDLSIIHCICSHTGIRSNTKQRHGISIFATKTRRLNSLSQNVH